MAVKIQLRRCPTNNFGSEKEEEELELNAKKIVHGI